MNSRITGMALIAAAVIMLAVILSFKYQIGKLVLEEIKNNEGVCIVEGECLHDKNAMPVQTYGGIIAASALLAFGVYLMFFGKQGGEPEAKLRRHEFEKALKFCCRDEKALLKKIIEAHGAIFQSELVDKTGFTKVKVTRILDALEGKRLIERKRRGMTNVVILKQP